MIRATTAIGMIKVNGKSVSTSSSQELAVAAVAPPSKAEFPLENPPGLRFMRTDEELILYYLKPKVAGDPIPASNFFADVDLYKFDPRTLIENRKGAGIDGDDRYFFTLRDRKYPNVMQPTLKTGSLNQEDRPAFKLDKTEKL